MRLTLGEALRLTAAVLASVLAPFWGVFALVCFPWIVTADHNPDIVRACERASAAAIGLAVVSMLTVVLAQGVFGKGRTCRCVALGLLAALGAASCFVYPRLVESRLLPLGLTAWAVGVATVLMGAAAFSVGTREGG
jgi:hypothetical protein